MTNPILITGHKNPDTDSICSAMAYANLKCLMGQNAVACRLGPLNEESKFVTKYFDIEGPMLIKDARSQLKDIQIDSPVTINLNKTAKDAWNLILGTSNRSLIVTDENGTLKGVLSTSNLSMIRLLQNNDLADLMSKASVLNIANTVNGDIIYEPDNFISNGKVTIITVDQKFSDQIANSSICIISLNEIHQIDTIIKGCKCLIVTGIDNIKDEVIDVAKKYNCALIKSYDDTMEVVKVVNESFPINLIMTKDIVTFKEDEFVSEVNKKISNTRFRSYPVINEFDEVVGQVSRFHLQKHRRKNFILVDHSAKNQSVLNIDEAKILEIIDHHHIGNIETDYPIYYRNQICGCTATIISMMYKENGFLPNPKYSGVLLSAIISDTLNFKSKTTTDIDIKTAKWLAKRAKVNINDYALELLGASVDIKHADLQLVLKRDLKVYDIGKYTIAVGQTNYRNVEDIHFIIEDFKDLLQVELRSNQYDLIIMMFTQVMAEGTVFEFTGSLSYIMEQVIETIFSEESGYDSGIISRKQQLIPKMGEILKRL